VIEVRLPSSLVALFPGTARKLARPDAPTVLALIEGLDADHPGMRDRLCIDAGPALRPYINVYVDGEPANLDSAVHPGATVHILPAVAGGSGSTSASQQPPSPGSSGRNRRA
jgi:molybdopterin synthase sulfur carrier subunit